MEQPSQQLIGREFVRQYYTLLNKTPEFLYRLYGRNSTYSRRGLGPNGGLSEAVSGRAKIQEKIASQKFKNSCAQIRVVDAHATINNGVVVLVIGELSNNGGPMRRFMQTFVLAAEGSAPNRFFIKNDLFLYNEEAFEESEPEDESEDEMESEEPTEEAVEEPAEEETEEELSEEEAVEEEAVEEEAVEERSEEEAVEEPAEEEAEEEEEVEELSEEEAVEEPAEEEAKAVEELSEEEAVEEVVEEVEAVEERSEEEAVEEPVEEPVKEAAEEPVEEPVKEAAEELVEEPVEETWTTVVKRKRPPPSVRPRPAEASSSQTPAVASTERKTAPAQATATETAKSRSDAVNRRGREDAQTKVEYRRVPRHPEAHQLFVGFIPRDATEDELKQFFSTFGRVVDLRIKSKDDEKVPNFGFITFDGPEVVQTILTSKPILFRNKIRLNVEKVKKKVAPENGPETVRGGAGGGGGSSSRPDDRPDRPVQRALRGTRR